MGDFCEIDQRVRFGLLGSASLLIGLIVPSSVAAAPVTSTDVEFFYRHEQVATANWTTVEDCGDGTTSETRISVIGGLEFESPDEADVNYFLTLRLLNFETCSGDVINETATGPANYTGTHSLRRAHVKGTVTLENSDEVRVNVRWRGHGAIDKEVNRTKFPVVV